MSEFTYGLALELLKGASKKPPIVYIIHYFTLMYKFCTLFVHYWSCNTNVHWVSSGKRCKGYGFKTSQLCTMKSRSSGERRRMWFRFLSLQWKIELLLLMCNKWTRIPSLDSTRQPLVWLAAICCSPAARWECYEANSCHVCTAHPFLVARIHLFHDFYYVTSTGKTYVRLFKQWPLLLW